ncbi:MAG: hypothetical protein JO227_22075 [Acetobacteraceae bacterium]|nr:hypothetical protein [Acetobacteraceae bacterium]
MSGQNAGPMPAACPRCRAPAIQVLSTSPVPGVWVIFGCKTCLYCWRSTEPEENRDPEKYPAAFRLTAAALSNLPIAPQVPDQIVAGQANHCP